MLFHTFQHTRYIIFLHVARYHEVDSSEIWPCSNFDFSLESQKTKTLGSFDLYIASFPYTVTGMCLTLKKTSALAYEKNSTVVTKLSYPVAGRSTIDNLIVFYFVCDNDHVTDLQMKRNGTGVVYTNGNHFRPFKLMRDPWRGNWKWSSAQRNWRCNCTFVWLSVIFSQVHIKHFCRRSFEPVAHEGASLA